MSESNTPHVGLYVTCLIDVMRPSVGFAAVDLLQNAGCRVSVPELQTCCGQPALNSGDVNTARKLAESVFEQFEEYDYVVVPSASCAAAIKLHAPSLFTGTEQKRRAEQFSGRVFELTQFLSTVCETTNINASCPARVAYHDGCSGKRELAINNEPRRLLQSLYGLELVDLDEADTCCGFGGTFAVEYSEISNAMVDKKCRAIENQAPDIIVGSELGCLLNIAGKLSRRNSPIACRHIAEVLIGNLSVPPITAKA